MKSKLLISLGRQIQLAACVFVLLPATLSYGPASTWFERLDLGLRNLTTPDAEIPRARLPIVVEINNPASSDARNDIYTDLLGTLNLAASVTITEPLPTVSDTLIEAIRYNGSVYLTDALTRDGNGSAARARAVARGIGHAALPMTVSQQHRGLQAWQLSGNVMRGSAALLPLMPDANWRERTEGFRLQQGLNIISKRLPTIPALTPQAFMAMSTQDIETITTGKHVYIGASRETTLTDQFAVINGREVSSLSGFGALNAALASSEVLRQPEWASTLNWLIIAVGMFMLVSALWRESRKMIAIAAGTLSATLLVAQWFLANQLALQIDITRPLVSLLAGFAICFWLTPDRTSNRRESFRAGLRYMRAGRLDAAFGVFRKCPPHPSLMPTLYKLAIAFEKRGQPEQARAVFSYMGRDNKRRQHEDSSTPAPARMGIPENIPEQLGRYEVLRPLGEGAMGGVFLGRDPRINRLIALKIVSFEQFDDEAVMVEMRARFFQEAESAGRLTHPGITAVYDSGEEDKLGYIAMEYVPGEQLTHYTAADALLDPLAVFRLGTLIAEALDYAHGEHVVHRDIKPANLLADVANESVKVTDFGVAKLIDAARTQTGIILGTPSYMSPEQARGDAVTGSSDLFSLGVTLYELLAGGVPFRGKTIAALMTAIAEKEPPKISVMRQGLPAGIDAFMDKALAKRPENRFADGSEMAFALRECASQMFGRVVNE